MLLPNIRVIREDFLEVVWKQADSSVPMWPRGCGPIPFL